MLCTFCPLTILGDFYRIPEKSPKPSADKMNRACEQRDQTLKKIRTLHVPDNCRDWVKVLSLRCTLFGPRYGRGCKIDEGGNRALGGPLLRIRDVTSLEAQQRYFSYRAMLVAIISQKCFVLVFYGVSHNYRAIRCKMGVSHRCVCVKLSAKGGVSHHFGGVLTSLKKYRGMGYRSDSIAISRDMGPLR